jgi:GntR family transcriptional regulator / MocR family aminotransferase
MISFHRREPIYRQIYSYFRTAILNGDLPTGSTLPSSRSLAAELNVSRTVVLVAFEQLAAEGYIEGVRGSRTAVCQGIPSGFNDSAAFKRSSRESIARPALSRFAKRLLDGLHTQPQGPHLTRETHLYDFHYGNREAIDFPHKLWRRLASVRMAQAVPTRSPTEGYPPLREALARYLARTRSVRCTPDQIVIVNGSQQALDLIARILIDPNDEVILEDPHYHGARQAFHAVGARLVPLSVDDDGLCVQELPRSRDRAPRLIFVTPSHQFPTGAILPLARRLALIKWAEKHKAYIIEDDYDGELRYDCRPIEAVQAHDRSGRVIYVGTFSKTLSPELRIGYVVVPQPLLRSFLAAKWVSDLLTPPLIQSILADLLASGYYERHLRQLRKRISDRRDALLESIKLHLDGLVTVSGASAGMHAVLWLQSVPVSGLNSLVNQAKQRGILVYPLTDFYLRPPTRSGILLSYSSLSVQEIHDGIKLLGQAIRSRK